MLPFNTISLNVSANAVVGNGLTVTGAISGVGNHIFEVDSLQPPVTIKQLSIGAESEYIGGNLLEVIGGYIDDQTQQIPYFIITKYGSIQEGIGTTATGIFSHAQGDTTTASGYGSHAEGYSTTASAEYSHAQGDTTTASGYGSHAEGFGTTASGDYSHAQGQNTTASGIGSHAEGSISQALGNYSHAEGDSIVVGEYSHAEGDSAIVLGNASHGEGLQTIIGGSKVPYATYTPATKIFTFSSANSSLFASVITGDLLFGYSQTANKPFSFVVAERDPFSGNITATADIIGGYSVDDGYLVLEQPGAYGCHAEGSNTIAYGNANHAEGSFTLAYGVYGNHAEGYWTEAIGGYGSHAAGTFSQAKHKNSWIWRGLNEPGQLTTFPKVSTTRNAQFMVSAEGGSAFFGNVGIGTDSIANALTVVGNISGNNLRTSFNQGSATGNYSFAEGSSKAFGDNSHAEGEATTASGNSSHAEGLGTTASGTGSHAEGYQTTASGAFSHAEGAESQAVGGYNSGYGTHAENSSFAVGNYSHSEGSSMAMADYSHSEGYQTNTGDRSLINSYSSNSLHSIFTFTSANSAKFNYHTLGTIIGGYTLTIPGNVQRFFTTKFVSRDTITGTISAEYLTVAGYSLTNNTYLFTYEGQYSHVEGQNSYAAGNVSHAEGFSTKATGIYSHSEGQNTTSSNQASHAEGVFTTASGSGSHAEGTFTTASGGIGSHAEGANTTASGLGSHAEGGSTQAIGGYSHAEGQFATASGPGSHAEGVLTTASGSGSHAEGGSTQAIGGYSHAEGQLTTASGHASHAEGHSTIASGLVCHAEGGNTRAIGGYSHSEGNLTFTIEYASHSEGDQTITSGTASHTEGARTNTGDRVPVFGYTKNSQHSIFTFSSSNSSSLGYVIGGYIIGGYGTTTPYNIRYPFSMTVVARDTITGTISANAFTPGIGGYDLSHSIFLYTNSGNYAHAEGFDSYAAGSQSHAEGGFTKAIGGYSHSEGGYTTASGTASHAEGLGTTASNQGSHAEGQFATASGPGSHAEGDSTLASNLGSHAEGQNTTASGLASHAEGQNTTASGQASHAEGNRTSAIGGYSHAAGLLAIANNNNSWIWRGMTTPSFVAAPIQTTRNGQFMVSAEGGVFFPGAVGIGTDSIANALTVQGNISANNITITNLGTFDTLQATVKNFNIQHPIYPEKRLQYSSIESPYIGIQLTGEAEVVNGKCVVKLPDYISELIHNHGVNIQITNYKHSKILYVDSINISKNQFTVKCDKFLLSFKKYKFFWTLNGIRKDVPELEVEI